MPLSQSINNKIEKKVFSEKDMSKLIKLVSGMKKKVTSPITDRQRLSVEISTEEGINYRSSSLDSREILPIIQDNKVISVQMSYFDGKNDTYFLLALDDSKYGRNFYSIRSERKKWFDETRTKVADYLGSVPSHENFYLRNRSALLHVARITIGIPIVFIIWSVTFAFMTGIVKPAPVENPPLWLKSLAHFIDSYWVVLYLALSYLQGISFASVLFEKLDSLWPNIEFNFGPKHKRQAMKVRAAWGYVATVVGIPVALSLLFFVLQFRFM